MPLMFRMLELTIPSPTADVEELWPATFVFVPELADAFAFEFEVAVALPEVPALAEAPALAPAPIEPLEPMFMGRLDVFVPVARLAAAFEVETMFALPKDPALAPADPAALPVTPNVLLDARGIGKVIRAGLS